MIVNILDHAAKWSPPDGTLEITLRGGERCVLTVTDNAPGIDESDRPHVFDRAGRRGQQAGVASAVMVPPTRTLDRSPAEWVGAAVLIAYGIVAGVVGTSILRRRDIA